MSYLLKVLIYKIIKCPYVSSNGSTVEPFGDTVKTYIGTSRNLVFILFTLNDVDRILKMGDKRASKNLFYLFIGSLSV